MSTSSKRPPDIAREWWLRLGRALPGDRAALARLRRCSSVIDAVAEPATARLVRDLGVRPSGAAICRVAALAAVLAHVREESSEKLAVATGPKGGKPTNATLKHIRFKALLAVRDHDDVLTAFRRVVVMLKGRADVRDLARLVLDWGDDERGPPTRARFAFDYYDAGFAAPDAAQSNESEARRD